MSGSRPAARLVVDVLVYAAARLVLVAVLTGVIFVGGHLLGVREFPIVVALLFALVIALPLGIWLFRPLRERATASIAAVDERRRQTANNCRRGCAAKTAKDRFVGFLVPGFRVDHINGINELTGPFRLPDTAPGDQFSHHPRGKIARALIREQVFETHRSEIEADGRVCVFGKRGGMILNEIDSPIDE